MFLVINLLQSTEAKVSTFKWWISKSCTSKRQTSKIKSWAILKTSYSQMSNITINGILEKVSLLICFFIEYMERLNCYGVSSCMHSYSFGNYFLIIFFSIIGYKQIGSRLKSNFFSEGNLLADDKVYLVYFMIPPFEVAN